MLESPIGDFNLEFYMHRSVTRILHPQWCTKSCPKVTSGLSTYTKITTKNYNTFSALQLQENNKSQAEQ